MVAPTESVSPETPTERDFEPPGTEVTDATPPAPTDFVEGELVCGPDLQQDSKLLTASMRWGVARGWCFRLTQPKPVKLPRLYRESTDRYAAQVKLTADGTALEGYVAGLPFPRINRNDPLAALKIMWNVQYGFAPTDDATAHRLELRTGRIDDHQSLAMERRTVIEAYRRLNYTGRLYVDPRPQLPNPDGIRFKESWHPVVEPEDRKNVGVTAYRHLDPARQDDTWLYLPDLRRVRRLSSAQRSDAIPISDPDMDLDSWWGFDAAIPQMQFGFLGESVILASVHARNVPVRWQDPQDWLFDDVWESRRVWIIEATPKQPQYAYGKRILFVDQEAWLVVASDIYDRRGQLWKGWVNMISFSKETSAHANQANDDEVGAIRAAVMIDMQRGHATTLSIPGAEFADENGWALNSGEQNGVSEEFFSIADLIQGR